MRRFVIIGTQCDKLNAVYKDLELGELKTYLRNHWYNADKDIHTFSLGRVFSVLDACFLGGSGNGAVVRAFGELGLLSTNP